MKNLNKELPSHPKVTDYENARFTFDDFGPPLHGAIIAVIPAANGVARYIYDYSKLLQIYAEFRGVDLDDLEDEQIADEDDDDDDDDDDDEKVIRHLSVETNAARYEKICNTIMDIKWEYLNKGADPLLVTDPEVESLMLDARDEEPQVIMIGGKEYWSVK